MDTSSAVPAENHDVVESADPVDQWLDRVTGRLAVDRELQLEVRLELRSHVEESIAEFRAAGRSQDDARDDALRTLGNEADLSEQLWRANRRRMKLRALATWAARLVLPPVAAALVVALSFGGLTSWAVFTRTGGGSENFPGEAALAQRASDVATRNAAPDVRLLVEQTFAPWDQRQALARQLVERYPDDPALRANFVAGMLNHTGVAQEDAPAAPAPSPAAAAIATLPTNAADNTVDFPQPPPPGDPVITVDERQFSLTLATFADAERREPGNALFPLLQAAVLWDASTIAREDRAHGVVWPGSAEPTFIPLHVVKDPARHALAVAALERAAKCAYFKTYAAELVRRQVDALPAASLQDLALRVRVQPDWRGGSASRWLWSFAQGGAVHSADEALLAARAGKSDAEVDPLLDRTRAIARRMAADAEDVRELQQAFGVYTSAEQTQAYVWAVRGDRERLRAQLLRCDALGRKVSRAARDGAFDYEHAGILAGADWSRAAGVDRAPVRRAEYAGADQVGVGALAACLLILAALYGTFALVRWLLVRRAAVAPRLFVGWRRCAVVVGVGAVLPVLSYFAYARLTPFGGRAFGLNMTWMRVEIEYAILGGVVILLTSLLAGRAVAARLRELRVTPPKSLTLTHVTAGWPRAAMVALASAGACLLLALFMPLVDKEVLRRLAMNFGNDVWVAQGFEVAAAAVLVAFAVGVRFGSRSGEAASPGASPRAVEYGWYARAALAPLMMAAIAVALIGLPLRFVEARAVRAAAASGQPAVYLGEVERSVLKPLRDQLVRGDVEVTSDGLREAAQRPAAAGV
jgi:hypothetical protein